MRFGVALLLGLTPQGAGCASSRDGTAARTPTGASAAQEPVPRSKGAIVSAVARSEGEQVTEILVVIDRAVHPLTLRRTAFLVVHADGDRSLAHEVIFAPGSALEDRRTLVLLGAFGAEVPRRVEIIGDLRPDDEAELRGANQRPRAENGPPEPVAAYARSADTGCPEPTRAVVVLWDRRIAAVDLSVAAPRITHAKLLVDPSAALSRAIAPASGDLAEAPRDPGIATATDPRALSNAVALCVATEASTEGSTIDVPAALVRSWAGVASTPARLRIEVAPPRPRDPSDARAPSSSAP